MSENYTAWGLAAGHHAFYADTLGRFYLFLTEAILNRLGSGSIDKALILNFHVGLRCAGDYEIQTEPGTQQAPGPTATVPFDFSLSNPAGVPTPPGAPPRPSLVQMLLDRLASGRPLKLGACSAAVVTEAYQQSCGDPASSMPSFMCTDYGSPAVPLSPSDFEKAVMNRFQYLARNNVALQLFHSAVDLPLTAVYLKFSQPVAPMPPFALGAHTTPPTEISELLATGLYEPRYATDVQQNGRDILMPIQILVSGAGQGTSETAQQIESLRNVYEDHFLGTRLLPVVAHMTPPRPSTVRIFISYYNLERDKKVVNYLKKKLESHYTSKGLDVTLIDGLGLAMAQQGQTFFQTLRRWTHAIDYAIVLLPLEQVERANVPYELGLFSQRFMSRDGTHSNRAVLMVRPSVIPKHFSDYTGVCVIPRSDPNSVGSERVEAIELFEKLKPHIPFLAS